MTDRELDAVAEVVGKMLGAFLTGVIVFFVAAGAITFFWNRVMPQVFGMPEINFGHGLYLSALYASFSFVSSWRR